MQPELCVGLFPSPRTEYTCHGHPDHNPMTLPASIPDLPSSHTGPAQPVIKQCGISTSTRKHLAYMPMFSLGVNSTRQGRFLKRRSRKFLDLTVSAS